MGRVTEEVLALLQERQDRRKAELDASWRDVQFDVGDDSEVLLDTAHTPLPSRSLPPGRCRILDHPCRIFAFL